GGLAVPDRCQAKGGARARKRAPGAAVKSNRAAASCRNEPKMFGSGKGGICAGTNAPARWMSAQIGQRSSAASSRSARSDGVSLEACVLAIAVASAEVSAVRSRCTWPNEMASWNASASSARYAPHLERDRNQPIVVTLHPLAAQTHSAGTSANCNDITFAKMGRPSRFLSPVAENQHCKLEPARCSRKNALARIRAIQDWQEI